MKYVCPSCGNELKLPEITSGSNTITCSCGWSGTENQLLATAYQEHIGSEEDTTRALVNDIRQVLSEHFAVEIGRFLKRWGFMEKPTAYVLGRYLHAISVAMLAAVIKEYAKLEKERTYAN